MSLVDTVVQKESYSRLEECIYLPVTTYQKGSMHESCGQIIQEIEISVLLNGKYVHTLTCSPWDIDSLAVGYLFFKGTIRDKQDIESVCVDEAKGTVEVLAKKDRVEQGRKNIVSFVSTEKKLSHKRPHYLDVIDLSEVDSALQVQAEQVNSLAVLLEKNSLLFKRTGGVHSALLIKNNEVLAWFEDIGRHSAVDKLAGWCLLNDVDASECILLFSGRVPYEIITKTIKLGCPLIISPGAPTDLSISLAKKYGVSLIGFAKQGQFNIYSHPERVFV